MAHFPKGSRMLAGDVSVASGYALIPGVRSISLQGLQADELNSTSHDTSGEFKDWIQGLKDWGTVSFECLWDPGNALHQQAFEDFKDGTERYYRIEINARGVNLGTFEFKGFVKSYPFTVPFDNLLSLQVEIRMKATPAPQLFDAS